MFFKRKRDKDLQLHGWAKFFHRLGRILLLPFIHPIWTLSVVLVLFLAPTFNGVKPVNVHKWYGKQIVGLYNKTLIWWGVRQPDIVPGELVFKPEYVKPQVKKTEKVEEKKPSAPSILDILKVNDTVKVKKEEKEEKTIEEVAEPKVKNDIRLPQNEKLYKYPADKKVFALKYLDYPHEIIGKAKVYNCNEIEINGEFIMMYGIYVHPYTAQGVNATKYLKSLIEDKEVKCGIVAYTEQGIATGICYYKDENINRGMVIKGYTKNVAL